MNHVLIFLKNERKIIITVFIKRTLEFAYVRQLVSLSSYKETYCRVTNVSTYSAEAVGRRKNV